MDPPQNPPQKEICEQHNLPVVFYQPNPNNNREALCFTCLQKLAGVVPVETYQQMQQLINQSKKQNNYDLEQIKNIVNSIIQFKNSFNNSLDKIIKIMLDQIEAIDQFMKKMQNIFDDQFNQLVSLEQIQKEFEDQKQQNQSIIHISKLELQDLKQNFSEMDIVFAPQMESQIMKQQIQLKEDRVLISDFVFNEQGNILIVINYGKIYVYQFEFGIVSKQLQKLTPNDHYAYCVNFMKNSNQFVSCGDFLEKEEKFYFPFGKFQISILIWERNTLKYEWFAKHELKLEEAFYGLHDRFDFSIIMNNQEDLLISKNSKVVSFWRKRKSWLYTDQCLNDSENTIITRTSNLGLLFLKLQNNKRWEDIQVIKGQFSPPCFTIGDQFVVINRQINLLEVYDYDKNLKQFVLLKQIKVVSDKQQFYYNFGNTFLKVNQYLRYQFWEKIIQYISSKSIKLVIIIQCRTYCLIKKFVNLPSVILGIISSRGVIKEWNLNQ